RPASSRRQIAPRSLLPASNRPGQTDRTKSAGLSRAFLFAAPHLCLSVQAAVWSFRFGAFSSREPVSASLENAPSFDCRGSKRCVRHSRMVLDQTNMACLRVERIIIDDRSRLPGRFFGRFATSATSELSRAL
ncbi:MAG TPA: hypothetical protein VMU69_20675, partial [Bradyrhizobium sp.]|nr:hypothetical protein [Bradyrhizobium sp.]